MSLRSSSEIHDTHWLPPPTFPPRPVENSTRLMGSTPPRPLSTTPVRIFTTRLPASTAGAQAASHSWVTSARKPSPGSDASVTAASPVCGPYNPMADAQMNAVHCGDDAASSASLRVGTMRESRMAFLWSSLNLPSIGSPAKCTTTSMPSNRSCAG